MILDRKITPSIHDAVTFDFSLPEIHKEELSNGIPFYWLNAGVQDVVEIDWIFPAGLWQEQKQGVAPTTAALLKNGTSTRTAHQINESLEFYGAALRVRAGNDYCTVSLYTLTKHLSALLPIVLELLTDATFPEEELSIYKQNTLQRLSVSLRQCDFVANQKIDAALFGENHPYGRYTRKERIEAITREDILSFYNKHYNLYQAKIMMAGKVGEKETKLINNIFGKQQLKNEPTPDSTFSKIVSTEKKVSIQNDVNGVQGAIRIGRQFPNRQHPDFAQLVVMNTLFGGYFGSRLMSNIREDKGYTYGIYSGMAPMMKEGTLVIQTEVGKDVVEAAVNEVYKEMDIMTNDKASEGELLLVKNYLLGNLLGDLEGPFSILQRWRTMILHGLETETFQRNVEIYKSITPQNVLDKAQQYLNKNDFHEIVVV